MFLIENAAVYYYTYLKVKGVSGNLVSGVMLFPEKVMRIFTWSYSKHYTLCFTHIEECRQFM